MTISYFWGKKINTEYRNHKVKIERLSEIKAIFFNVPKTIYKGKLTKILSKS